MLKSWKRILTLTLNLALAVGCFAACGGKPPEETKPTPTEPAEEAKVLKILTIGHSLAVDCGHMMNLIFATEGMGDYEEVRIATLYYSGCPLKTHVNFLTNNEPKYELYLSSTTTPNNPPTVMRNVTMLSSLEFDYWDIIVMQGGVFEIGHEATYNDGNIQIIQNYVNEHKLNKNAVFAWHMPWVLPTDKSLRDLYPYSPNVYYTEYVAFNDDRTTFYNAVTDCVEKNIVSDSSFIYLIPSGTAIENALSSYLTEPDLHRDFAHATDLASVIASYTWYCKVMGVDKLEQIKLNAIPRPFLRSTEDKSKERVLTEEEKALILESVNNALANPLQMTQSRYTEAPAQ